MLPEDDALTAIMRTPKRDRRIGVLAFFLGLTTALGPGAGYFAWRQARVEQMQMRRELLQLIETEHAVYVSGLRSEHAFVETYEERISKIEREVVECDGAISLDR